MSDAAGVTRGRDHLARDLSVYILARFGLIVVVTGLLVLFKVPLLVAAAIGIVVGLPAGLLLFRRLNARVTAGLAARGAGRAAERAKLRAQLRGEHAPDAEQGSTPEQQADPEHDDPDQDVPEHGEGARPSVERGTGDSA